jgi:hypothetical protein
VLPEEIMRVKTQEEGGDGKSDKAFVRKSKRGVDKGEAVQK